MISAGMAAVKAQIQMTCNNVEDLLPVLTIPLSSIAMIAIFANAGREDLAGYALIAALLMTVGQMGFFVGSEVVANDRNTQVLELILVTDTPYWLVLVARILTLTIVGVVGFLESWLIAWIVFDYKIQVHDLSVFTFTLLATLVAITGTCIVTAAIFCFGRTTRTLQNIISGPLYLVGGVLVPVTFLPDWIQVIAQGVFFYWAADLLRATLTVDGVQGVAIGIWMILFLGICGGAVGVFLLQRMLDRLRRNGALSLL